MTSAAIKHPEFEQYERFLPTDKIDEICQLIERGQEVNRFDVYGRVTLILDRLCVRGTYRDIYIDYLWSLSDSVKETI